MTFDLVALKDEQPLLVAPTGRETPGPTAIAPP